MGSRPDRVHVQPAARPAARRTTPSCFAAPSSRSAAASATTRRSWPDRRFPSSSGAAGTSTSRCRALDRRQRLLRQGREAPLSREGGMQWLAGLLEHAMPASVFTTPTITGYKRLPARLVRPNRVTWAIENRGALMRVIGEPGSQSVSSREPRRRPGGEPVPLPGLPGRLGARRHAPRAHAGRTVRGAVPRRRRSPSRQASWMPWPP